MVWVRFRFRFGLGFGLVSVWFGLGFGLVWVRFGLGKVSFGLGKVSCDNVLISEGQGYMNRHTEIGVGR